MMTSLIHKSYGRLGSEFIIRHPCVPHRKLFIVVFIAFITLLLLKLYEMDIIFLWLASLTGAALVFQILYRVSEETLLVVPSVGVQVKTQYWLGNEKTEFFDRSCVKGIIINEAITMQSVIYYLAVLLTNSKSGKVEQVYPLFTVVQNIWDNRHMMGLTSMTSEKDDYLCEGSSQGQTAAKDLMGGGDDRLRP
ncbi:phosphatidylinositol N-acetylglucosaminyltransferase subunit H-like isoform X2 [Pomacea canaliculata]|uniref:phosphatidylinositol N-acetylglucosaminyltransferase subunit H-like isoform X2 n=1 Tax=Pomacea canaliculata TaxID=400727 RepID=UPI000D73FDF9|nr:phosphatidylinositol N-acetylglucosaminyltransferase subunit H-like isoform X2 [Pomacea canaliculata]